MPHELQLKPFEEKEGFKYVILQVTDIAWHTNKLRPTELIGEKVRTAIDTNTPGRIYTEIDRKNGLSTGLVDIESLKKNPDFIKFIQEQEKQGVKVLLHIPKDGVPMAPGKDTVKFMQSTKGKRILHWLYKKLGAKI
ncbi:MAG: hypothetical protein A3C62_01445 [Candidatus Zambryskibacteria bacterium RIFCSPHIGHO2_02_FULL_39_16]|uniref:Uncharacterized protein n=1 Tax=Candidatus Zambryskibacteria bacterium RIFCSPLOWO2_02_FULL_39_14 TaxID=1802769 RepID=A0A1G2UGC9_9BACT|nr:MAG: hypothetical protein A3C62_01445 [Candidatus Zambryskibacteria bacterium RIFCSPHIGHO2_02_FULL_39_16]OHB08476.1 MAG: hypothetical protein A3I86_00275 [Candidatus Zambryskibacteria bacterium RIFCSPLOWO2_02_FULL_39_14]